MRSVSDYAKQLVQRIEDAETKQEAETARWLLEGAIETIIETKGETNGTMD